MSGCGCKLNPSHARAPMQLQEGRRWRSELPCRPSSLSPSFSEHVCVRVGAGAVVVACLPDRVSGPRQEGKGGRRPPKGEEEEGARQPRMTPPRQAGGRTGDAHAATAHSPFVVEVSATRARLGIGNATKKLRKQLWLKDCSDSQPRDPVRRKPEDG